MPDWQGPYQLKIKVISGALTRNTDFLTKMSPYPLLEFNRGGTVKQIKGPTHKSGHKAPLWNWEADIFFGGEPGKSNLGSDTFLKI